MPIEMSDLIDDLAAEAASLDALVAHLAPAEWATTTPAPGWTILDQIVHLALFDERACWSITDPARFRDDLSMLARGVDIHARERARAHDSVLSWWRTGNRELRTAVATARPESRCEWYGPSMSAASLITARIMETWAHAHDVADALGAPVTASNRLRHVAHIGVRARPFSYASNKRDVPSVDVRVEVVGPDGDTWVWGAVDAGQCVSGPALHFCQVVTQRRHVDDTALVVVGDHAREWMQIAQAFAGPPGKGRRPGQFAG